MFAIVQTGGKQYNVTEGDIIKVEKLSNAVGDKINLEVLLVSSDNKVVAGTPTVKGAEVTAEVLSHGKGDKIVVYKYKPKKNERKKQGHRQPWTDEGSDIVCSAVSTATQMAVCGINEVLKLNTETKIKDGYLKFGLSKQDYNNEQAQFILKTMFKTLQDITRQYGDYVKMEVKRDVY